MAHLHLSGHARERAAEMGVPVEEVLGVLDRPEVDLPSEIRRRRLAVGGRLAVPYVTNASGTIVAITVLWRGEDHR